MINDIEDGKINTVITKDLSRLGREYLKTGDILENYFPEKGVRYIAVSDNEDTDIGLSDFVPFKNLFNEWFAKDTSRKVKTALRAKFNRGERMCVNPPIGYMRDPDNPGHLMIDEEYAWIIQKIFKLALDGVGSTRITNILKQEKIPVSSWINYERYGLFSKIYDGQPEDKKYQWTLPSVLSILKDETYIGNSIHYKQSTISYKNKTCVRKPESEWLRIENTHPGIVAKEDFEQVQQMIKSRRRAKSDGTPQIFAGLLYCSDCGWSMKYKGSGYHPSYICGQYSRGMGLCNSHHIRYDDLYEIVLNRIRFWVEAVNENSDNIAQKLIKSKNENLNSSHRKITEELKKSEKRLKELTSIFSRLYEDRLNGIVTERNFLQLSEKYQQEQEALDEKITALKNELSQRVEQVENVEKWVEALKQYSDPTELNEKMLNALIKKIVIHPAKVLEDKTKEQEIDIYFRFVGKIF